METDTSSYDISVILTIYNSRKLFSRALQSVLSQTFNNYEIIIVDDGSTDETEIEIFSYLKKYNFIKYIRHSNRKHPLSLNTGILNSTGKYITFIDSDDEYSPLHLEERIRYFSENENTDLIHSPATLIGDDEDLYVPDANDTSRLIHLNECIIGGTLFGRKEVFLSLGGFMNMYSHDYDFYLRAEKIFSIEKFNSPTYIYYRNNPESVINKMKAVSNGQK